MDRGSFLLGLGVGIIVMSFIMLVLGWTVLANVRGYVSDLKEYTESPEYAKIKSLVEAQSYGAERDPVAILNNIQYTVNDLENAANDAIVYEWSITFMVIGIILVIISYRKKKQGS